MAEKGKIRFDAEQVAALAAAANATVSEIESVWSSDVQAVFTQLRSDDIIEDSSSKAPLLAALNEVEKAYQAVVDKIGRIKQAVEVTLEATQVSVNKNIATTEDAAQTIAAARKKVEESTGANA